MSADELRKMADLRDIPEDLDEDYETIDDDYQINIADVLSGSIPLDISHAGGEFQDLLADAEHDNRYGGSSDFATPSLMTAADAVRSIPGHVVIVLKSAALLLTPRCLALLRRTCCGMRIRQRLG